MHKTIIPGLVTFDTPLKTLRGSYFARDLHFFEPTKTPARYHYQINLSSDISIPERYDFRNGYYLYANKKWYYERRLPLGLTLKFSYEPHRHTFTLNRLYSLIPFEIGGILPAGKHIADVVGLDLALDGYTVVRGFAYRIGEEAHCCIAPSFNGKTTLMKQILERGGQYIAEDILVMHGNQVYPTAAIGQNYGRGINKNVETLARHQHADDPQPVTSFTVLHNATTTEPAEMPADVESYLLMNTLTLSESKFIRSYVLVHNLTHRFLQTLRPPLLASARIMRIHNYNFEQLFSRPLDDNKQHWDEMGESYSAVWQSPARQWLSRQELSFIKSYAAGHDLLDIGVGNGRIIAALLELDSTSAIYGLDIAASMVEISRKRFKDEPRVKSIKVTDLASQTVPFEHNFDAVTCIRVLKYNANWPAMITKLSRRLKPGGKLILTMANQASLNRFSRYPIPTYKTTPDQLILLLERQGLEVVKLAGFTRIPDKVYEFAKGPLLNKLICLVEQALMKALPSGRFSRELFVVARKP